MTLSDIQADTLISSALPQIVAGLRHGDPTVAFDVVSVSIDTLEETFQRHTFVGLSQMEAQRFLAAAYVTEFGTE